MIILLVSGLQWNSNSSVCPDAFDKVPEEQALNLAMKAEDLLRQPEIYIYEKTQSLVINNIQSIIAKWVSTGEPLSRSKFNTLKEDIERLDTLLKTSEEGITPEYSDNATSSKSANSLNAVIVNDMQIKPNKLYTVKSSHGSYDFNVAFSEKTAKNESTKIEQTKELKEV